ncbi:MAG: adenosylmethionine--8-amino-7-oxononanoate transaminase [Gammaproteobacteria bacterium]|jgi:adenosylmethionine---8-amino-7-oxononanoate aminotransferase|nr:adenosylmethionine--8-amino-7-oxononanoate transaminase [Gammaproteobacteria bacterium]MBT7603948.1 adenosylmethionine--8-amino-7-oxononanoate transaminase [Gammaproteobacteria bacterium]
MIKDDKLFVWHPYASAVDKNPLYAVEKAKGVYIYLDSGKKLIDGMSSWWCVINGYNHPELNKAIKQQVDKFSHIMFGGFTHNPAIQLAKKINEITPSSLQKVFFSDSGSVSVEVAMKFSIQYWYSQNKTSKKKFLTVKNGYHGDTIGTMSISDPINGMHSIFNKSLLKQIYVAKPEDARLYNKKTSKSLQQMENTLKKLNSSIAAVIIEPILQGAGGMRIYHSDYLVQLRKLCNKYNVLLILDEVATGFGRTGKLFGFNHANIVPDILCLGKSLTGGYMSLAATVVTKKIAKSISEKAPGIFMHGPTYMANPLACSVALANLNLLFSYDWEKNVKSIETILNDDLEKISKNKAVKDFRVIGAVGILEMKEKVDVGSIQKKFVQHGIWLRPFSNLIYVMPPYIISKKELKFLMKQLNTVINMEYKDL